YCQSCVTQTGKEMLFLLLLLESRLWIPTRKGTLPPQSQKRTLYSAGWVPGWDEKRSMVVADDTAFREKSKMLTTMERQKWLNSYMQKFLVVNSK
uniref:Tuberoinfundibular peptide of 39 residues n=1 Tax=Salvator merianae TaxID=96440 RepID=A0A8D0B9A2_SALMN